MGLKTVRGLGLRDLTRRHVGRVNRRSYPIEVFIHNHSRGGALSCYSLGFFFQEQVRGAVGSGCIAGFRGCLGFSFCGQGLGGFGGLVFMGFRALLEFRVFCRALGF